MTDGEAVSLREHIDQRFDAMEKEVRGVHHRLTEVQDHNRLEHRAAADRIEEIVSEYRGLAERVDALEAHRDERSGARRIIRRVGAIGAGIVTAAAALWEMLIRG